MFLEQTKKYLPYFIIFGGTAIFAYGLHMFVVPYEFMEGGITGISLLLHYGLGIAPSASTLAMNVPLFYFCWKYSGKRYLMMTVYGTLCLTLSLTFMEWLISQGLLNPFGRQFSLWLAAGCAGVCSGAGLGIVFRCGATTGGSDIIALICHQYTGWRVGKILLAFDAIVLSISMLYLPLERVALSLIVVIISTTLIDMLSRSSRRQPLRSISWKTEKSVS